MRDVVVARAAQALATAVLAIVLNFVLFRAIPGDAADSFGAVPGATPELRAQLREQFGLDGSIWEQLVRYVTQLAQGNLGVSLQDRRPVSDHLVEAIGASLPLMLCGTLLGVGLGLLAGTIAAWRRGRAADSALTGTALIAYAMPSQWVGLLLILALGGVFATGGSGDPFLAGADVATRAEDYARHLVLPAVTLGISVFGMFTVLTRSAVAETLSESYVLTARAEGLSTGLILRRFALRNAMAPISTLIAIQLGFLLGGATLVEAVFSWPGIGYTIYQAVLARDYPLLQGAFLVLTLAVALCMFVADLLALRLDPRLRTAS